jgi:hypothetical protein
MGKLFRYPKYENQFRKALHTEGSPNAVNAYARSSVVRHVMAIFTDSIRIFR